MTEIKRWHRRRGIKPLAKGKYFFESDGDGFRYIGPLPPRAIVTSKGKRGLGAEMWKKTADLLVSDNDM
jgi:hypothetical protein